MCYICSFTVNFIQTNAAFILDLVSDTSTLVMNCRSRFVSPVSASSSLALKSSCDLSDCNLGSSSNARNSSFVQVPPQ